MPTVPLPTGPLGLATAPDVAPVLELAPAPTVVPAPAAPSVPAVPSAPAVPSIPAPAVPLDPTQLTGIPQVITDELPGAVVTPVVGMIDAVTPVIDRAVGSGPTPPVPEVPPVPELLPGPELPPLAPGSDAPQPNAEPSRAGPLELAAGTAFHRAVALPSTVQAGPASNTGYPGFVPQLLVLVPAASSATAETPSPAGAPPGKPLPPSALPVQAGAANGPQGGSAHGAADLPDQRALAPPMGGPAVRDGPQIPTAGPAFDPGSSPD